MKGFPGFPPGKARWVTLPEAVFGELLPLIDDLAELKVTLHCYWRLSQEQGAVRFVRWQDLANDETLLTGLEPDTGGDPVGIVRGALERAIARGTLLHVRVERDGETQDWYFANTPKGRAAVQSLQRGERPDEMPAVTQAESTRPNIFVLYEQNIGALTPLIADELRDAEQNYPISWIEEAIKLAVESNVRRWRYILAILEKWREQGRQEQDGISRRDTKKQLRGQVPKEYEDIVKR